ncbi:hypothetical protein SAMN06295924_104305 [Rathayibacter rathayi NCPPB 2980 = VKM Ac-1601]|nr:hypothetical protein FB469_2545 [Rathayibacter rathayi]SOE04625.1 hypothetical protein SAMN06295924_104305 [Rathayibacter rathayi NCPPB 2980 = VKM Ac-1601]
MDGPVEIVSGFAAVEERQAAGAAMFTIQPTP